LLFDVREKNPERAIIFCVARAHTTLLDGLLDELEALAETAGAEVRARLIQIRESPTPGTYLGSGKVEELKTLLSHLECDLAICDDELAPVQLKNLEKALEVRVIDRTQLILDIFAQRARSAEGKLQVEAAQLAYSLPRIRGKGLEMSNPGAGIGTRGPGETKLETDRRKIRTRLADLRHQIDDLSRQRGLIRESRRARGVPTIALVGYTNAGKSTVLNALTAGGALAEDKLFATLDPTSRETLLGENRRALVVDTVGFIRKLPHQLVKAFRATLEEVQLADVVVHVVDVAHPEAAEQVTAVEEVLQDLGVMGKPLVLALNKIDLVDEIPAFKAAGLPVKISAKTGLYLDDLRARINEVLVDQPQMEVFLIPFERGDLLSYLHENGDVKSIEYTESGAKVQVELLSRYARKLESELGHDRC
jgi:GTP-binding protein HflX